MAAPTNSGETNKAVEEFQETTDFSYSPLLTPLPQSMPTHPPLSYLAPNQQLAYDVGESPWLANFVGEFPWLGDDVGEFSYHEQYQQLVDTTESMILPQLPQELHGYSSDASDLSAGTDLSWGTDMSIATDCSGATDMSVTTDLGGATHMSGATGDDEVGIGLEGTGELGEMEEGRLNSGCLEKGETTEKTPGGGGGNKRSTGVRIAVSLEDILLTKEMTIKDAAKHLKVGRSTLKRVCREYGIHRWPPRMEKNLNGSLLVVDQEGGSQLKSHKPTPSNQFSVTVDTNRVIVKARYEDFTIKFKLYRPWLMVELEHEVEMRLQLKAGTYYINYKDEDNDSILIACDADLQHCIASSRQQGTTSIEMNLYSKVIKTENFQEPFFTGKQLKDEFLKLIVFIPSNKRTFELQAKNHETVENIKLLIQLKKGILPEQYSLFYRGKLLEDNKTLASLDIQSESVLFLVFNPRDVMSVSVKMPSGEILKLEVKALHTVHDVRAIIQSMVGVAASNQNLTYEGRQVDDSKTLACYNIKENSLLEMLPLLGLPFQIFVKDLAGKTIALNVFKGPGQRCEEKDS